jgi:hypothetical protein
MEDLAKFLRRVKSNIERRSQTTVGVSVSAPNVEILGKTIWELVQYHASAGSHGVVTPQASVSTRLVMGSNISAFFRADATYRA